MTSLWSRLCTRIETHSNRTRTRVRRTTQASDTTTSMKMTSHAVSYDRMEIERVERHVLPELERRVQCLIDDFSLALNELTGLTTKTRDQQSRRQRAHRPNKVNIEREISLLRTTMRRLRRWRNGSEFYTVQSAHDMRLYIIRSRERLLMHKMERIYEHMSYIRRLIDRSKSSLPQSVHRDKEELDMQMSSMNDLIRTKSSRGVSLDEIPEIEQAINDVHTKSTILRETLSSLSSSSSSSADVVAVGGGSPVVGSKVRKGSKLTDNRELVNRLFRCARRIRQLIDSLKRGNHHEDSGYCSTSLSSSASYHHHHHLSSSLSSIATSHQTVTEAARSMPEVNSTIKSSRRVSSPRSETHMRKVGLTPYLRQNHFSSILPKRQPLVRHAHTAQSELSINVVSCAQNDVTVLGAELSKIKAWLQEKVAMSESELIHVEMIITELESHIKSDLDARPKRTTRRRDRLILDSDVSDDVTTDDDQGMSRYDDHMMSRNSRTRSRSPPPLIMRSGAELRARHRSDDQLQSTRGLGRLKVKVKPARNCSMVNDTADIESLLDERLI